MMTSSTEGAHSIHTVRGVGSSRALSRASAASLGEPVGILDDDAPGSRPTDGRWAASATRSRACATLIDSPSVAMTSTSAWVPLERGAALAALAAAAVGAEQRRGEGPGGDRAARAGRAGEEPGVGHRRRGADGVLERGDRGSPAR